MQGDDRRTIAVDCRFAGTLSGLGRYTRELVPRLLRRGDPLRYILFVRSAEEPWLRTLPARSADIRRLAAPHYSFAEQGAFPLALLRARADLLFSPHFTVPLLCPVPFIVTVHDLILHRYPNEASLLRRMGYRCVMAHAVARARRVVTVSEFTARELCSIYGESLRDRIVRVPEGVSGDFRPRTPEEQRTACRRYDLRKPYCLYVGNAKQHKNVQMLIDAFALLPSETRELVLVTGGKEASRLVLRSGVRLLPDVPERDLPALYSAAEAFVTASLYEGFCLPVAEARACGCPIIAGRSGAIPEVAGPRALLVEPTVEALAGALRRPPGRALPPDTPPLSWDRAAEQVAALLRSA
jgi:glycosyltransferase involved in cell wall biosynthesis